MPAPSVPGYQHTLAQLRTKVRALLLEGSSSSSTWTDAKLNSYINDAIDDVRNAGIMRMTGLDMLSTAGEQYIVPANYIWKIANITYDDYTLYEMTLTEFNDITGGDWDESTGIPYRWWDSGDAIWFDCKMATGGLTIHITYNEASVDLVADSDLCGFGKTVTNVLVYGAITYAWLADQNAQQTTLWQGKYQNALDDALFQQGVGHSSIDRGITDRVGWRRRR